MFPPNDQILHPSTEISNKEPEINGVDISIVLDNLLINTVACCSHPKLID